MRLWCFVMVWFGLVCLCVLCCVCLVCSACSVCFVFFCLVVLFLMFFSVCYYLLLGRVCVRLCLIVRFALVVLLVWCKF